MVCRTSSSAKWLRYPSKHCETPPLISDQKMLERGNSGHLLHASVAAQTENCYMQDGLVLRSPVVSRGRCKTGLEFIRRSLKSQRFSWSLIQTQSDLI